MKLTPQSVEKAALHYLRRFPASKAHLRRVLARKAGRIETSLSPSEVGALLDAAVAAMARRGLVDDAAFARALAGSLHRRGDSRRLIRRKLEQKLVPEPDIEAALDALAEQTEDVDLDAAWAFARRRRLGPFRSPEQRLERRDKDLAALGRRGFSFGIARRVIDADEVP